MSEEISNGHNGKEGVTLLGSSGQRPGMLLNVPLHTGSPHGKELPALERQQR